MFCKYCKKEKPQEDFKKCNVVNGITYYRLKCSACKQATQRIRVAKNREALAEIKKSLICQKCNNSDHRVLEFHHIDGTTKENNIANLTGYSLESIKKEIDKCVCLCANCHRIHHYDERNGVPSET